MTKEKPMEALPFCVVLTYKILENTFAMKLVFGHALSMGFLAVFALSPFGLCLDLQTASASQTSQKNKSIRFWVAHRPENTENNQLMQEFAKRVQERTAGEIEIVFEFDKQESAEGALEKVYVGEKEMSQVPVNRFTEISPQIDVLDLPMIFRSHGHAQKVMDGEIGKELLRGIASGSNDRLNALSFTYSGGVRVIYGVKNLVSLKYIEGTMMRFRSGRMNQDMTDHLGLKFIRSQSQKWFFDGHLNGTIETEEAEINRIAAYQKIAPEAFGKIQSVLETNHSLYLTMIIVNGKFFRELSDKQRSILQQEAQKLAENERALSIQQAVSNRKVLVKAGIKVNQLNGQDMTKLKEISKKGRAKHRRELGSLMNRISAVDSHDEEFISVRH